MAKNGSIRMSGIGTMTIEFPLVRECINCYRLVVSGYFKGRIIPETT